MFLLKYEFILEIINFVCVVWIILGFCIDVLCVVFIKDIILFNLIKNFKIYIVYNKKLNISK